MAGLGLRTGVIAVGLSLVGAVLAPLPLDAVAPKASEVAPLGVKGKAPEAVLATASGNYQGAMGKPSGKSSTSGLAGFDPQRSVVVDELTTETRQVFRNPSGSLTASVSPGPVRFRDAKGKWTPFDLGLRRDQDGLLRPKATPTDVAIHGEVGADALVAEVTVAGERLALSVDGLAPGAKATIPDVEPVMPVYDGLSKAESAKAHEALGLPKASTGDPHFVLDSGVALMVSPDTTGIKTTYELGDGAEAALAGAGRLVERLALPAGWSARQGDGVVELVDGTGVAQAFWVGGEVSDAGESGETSSASMQLVEAGEGFATAKVMSDPAWLTDPARVFPIVVDPGVVRTPASGSGDMDMSTSGASSAGTELRVGKQSLTTAAYRSLVTLNLSGLEGYDVKEASLELREIYKSSCVAGLATVVQRNTSAWTTASTWASLPTTVPDDLGSTSVCGSNTTANWVSVDLTAMTEKWLNNPPSANYGVTLSAENESLTGYGRKFSSYEAYAGGVYAPTLHMSLGHRPTEPTALAPADGVTSISTTPTLSVNPASDADNDTLYYTFFVSTSPDGRSGQTILSPWQTATTWTVPAGSLRDGVTYYWRVDTADLKPRPGGMTDAEYIQHQYNNPSFIVSSSWVRKFKVDLRLGDGGPSPMDQAGPVGVNLATGNATISLGTPSLPTVGGAVGVQFTYNSQAPSQNGLLGKYYPDNNDNGLFDEPVAFERVDPSIYFDWGTGSPYPALGGDHFMASWSGFLTVPRTGTWALGTVSDDGTIVTLDGSVISDNWNPHSAGPILGSTSVSMSAGVPKPIKVDYQEVDGAAAMQLWIKETPSDPTAVWIPVPPSWLTQGSPTMPAGWSMSADLDGNLSYVSARVSEGSVVLVGPGGETHEFARTASGFSPPIGEDGVLAWDALGQLSLHDTDGRTYSFSSQGVLLSATTPTDDRNPAAPIYTWSGTSPRLTTITDPVSTKAMTLSYGGDAACPGANAAPAAMLCRVSLWDGTVTDLMYSSGLLTRVVNPGGSTTDLGWTNGRLSQVRDPLAYDALAAGVRVAADLVTTDIAYDGSGRVASVILPAPLAGGASRPAHTYGYGSGTTSVTAAGQSGAIRTVTFDDRYRLLNEIDATNKTSSRRWDLEDRVVAAVDPKPRRSTTIYDYAGRPSESFGPAPDSWFGADNRPLAANVATTPRSVTNYDEGIVGLAGSYWNNGGITGAPVLHGTGVGDTSGAVDANWGTGGPSGVLLNGTQVTDNWSIRLTGDIVLPAAGTYGFSITSDSATRLYIDDKWVSGDWAESLPSGSTSRTSTLGNVVSASAGSRHRIQLDMIDTSGSASLRLNWTPPGGTSAVVPGAQLSPRYGLITSKVAPDGKVTRIGYQYPHIGLATSGTEDANNLGLVTQTSFETPGTGFLRRTSRTLPAGNASSYSYYGNTESVTNPCPGGTPTSQAGLLKSTTSPDPDGAGPELARSSEQVYDSSGRVVAARSGLVGSISSAPWACVTYDQRGRVSQG